VPIAPWNRARAGGCCGPAVHAKGAQLGDGLGATVAVAVGDGVGVGVLVGVFLGVGVDVAVGVAVGVGVTVAGGSTCTMPVMDEWIAQTYAKSPSTENK
jgi:hypothetical protein